jgi:hypothetical protein
MRKQHERKTLEYARALPDGGLGRKHDSCSDLPPTQPLDKIFSPLSVGRMNKRPVIVILQRLRNHRTRSTGAQERVAVAMKAKRTVGTERSNYQVKRMEPVMVGSDMQARLFTLAPRDKIPWH